MTAPTADLAHYRIRAALRQQLQAVIAAHVGVVPATVAWEGRTFTPVLGTPYIREKLIANGEDPASLGMEQHTMLYTLRLMFPANGDGTKGIELAAGKVKGGFAPGDMHAYDGQGCIVMKSKRSEIMTDAQWQSVVVTVDVSAYTVD